MPLLGENWKRLTYFRLNEFIKYYGPFKANVDIPGIYNTIDLSFAVYDSASRNVQLALPNKLYESMFFNVPMLVAKNTSLHKEVMKSKIGVGISLSTEKQFSEDIRRVSPKKIEYYANNSQEIHENELLDDSKDKLKTLLEIYL